MSWDTFWRTVPVRPGWKREYYDGKAHVRPSWSSVAYELDLARRPERRMPGLRTCTPSDRYELVDAFIDSFRYAPEYADYPMKKYRQKAAEYVDGCIGTVRGEMSPASTVLERDGQIVAAAIIKVREKRPPLLDCLLVRPRCFRKGFATAVVARAANRLVRLGFSKLESGAMLANEPSLAWHLAFGFREKPNYFTSQVRYHSAIYERERLVKYCGAKPDNLVELDERIAQHKAEYRRVMEMRENGVYRDPFLDFDDDQVPP
jgi:N-acetylglutamate synthase-like GNAT family acetyltransferase